METITLSKGIEMPTLGFGVFQTPPDETRDAVRAALACGYRHIDTAAAYGNERQVGEAVSSSDVDRSEVFLETKIWISDYGYNETLHAFEKSARKLGGRADRPAYLAPAIALGVRPYPGGLPCS
jgi:2,5-diketo-D-gluconate reductase A